MQPIHLPEFLDFHRPNRSFYCLKLLKRWKLIQFIVAFCPYFDDVSITLCKGYNPTSDTNYHSFYFSIFIIQVLLKALVTNVKNIFLRNFIFYEPINKRAIVNEKLNVLVTQKIIICIMWRAFSLAWTRCATVGSETLFKKHFYLALFLCTDRMRFMVGTYSYSRIILTHVFHMPMLLLGWVMGRLRNEIGMTHRVCH